MIDRTGVGPEGGGGVSNGQVQSEYIEGGDHLMPYKMPGKAAKLIADWLRGELEKWEEEEVRRRRDQPPFDPGVLNSLWAERFSKL